MSSSSKLKLGLWFYNFVQLVERKFQLIFAVVSKILTNFRKLKHHKSILVFKCETYICPSRKKSSHKSLKIDRVKKFEFFRLLTPMTEFFYYLYLKTEYNEAPMSKVFFRIKFILLYFTVFFYSFMSHLSSM